MAILFFVVFRLFLYFYVIMSFLNTFCVDKVMRMDVGTGERIRLHRLIKRMTQAELGKIIGVSSQAVGLYEKGEREPNISQLRQLAGLFNVTLDYLLGMTPLSDAEKFLIMIDFTDAEILSKCKLMVDGREMTEDEAKWFISMVRSHRHLTDPKT
jgi:transcriptional regulator with XRE-family HTH domain